MVVVTPSMLQSGGREQALDGREQASSASFSQPTSELAPGHGPGLQGLGFACLQGKVGSSGDM